MQTDHNTVTGVMVRFIIPTRALTRRRRRRRRPAFHSSARIFYCVVANTSDKTTRSLGPPSLPVYTVPEEICHGSPRVFPCPRNPVNFPVNVGPFDFLRRPKLLSTKRVRRKQYELNYSS